MSGDEVSRRRLLEIGGLLGTAGLLDLYAAGALPPLAVSGPNEPNGPDHPRRPGPNTTPAKDDDVNARPDAVRNPPNVVLIMADDMGYSDLGCYGSEIRTPNLDALAADGVRMSQFYNTARCSPARASLLTGLHPHQTGIGVLTNNDGPQGYPGTINNRCLTMAEVLGSQGYTTAMRGKWHLSGHVAKADGSWPTRRGFDSYFGIVAGASSYYDPHTLTRGEDPVTEVPDDFYLTNAIGAEAAEFVRSHGSAADPDPFFLYLPFTAPHWPLHAPDDAVQRYRGAYDEGWDVLRKKRYRRLVESGLIDDHWALSDRDPEVVDWKRTADKQWQARRMEVYAAQVELLDRAIGKVVEALKATDAFDNTLIIFLSDNGGCAEEIVPAWGDQTKNPAHAPVRTKHGERVHRGNDPKVLPGGPTTYASYGKPWANLSNTPFREYKRWVHEGGISTPFIAHWPAGNLQSGIDHTPHQLPDVLATVIEATGTSYPETFPGRDPLPLEGESMLGSWRSEPATRSASTADAPRRLFFEHMGNCAVREGRWKLVRKYRGPWELYDLATDRTELHDLSVQHPDRVAGMSAAWQKWADRCGVLPRAQVLATSKPNDVTFVKDEFQSSRSVP